MDFNTYAGGPYAHEMNSIYFGKSENYIFPEQVYQQVEYLETDGKAYIMTTHQPSQNTRTVAEFSGVDTSIETDCPLFGARDEGSLRSYFSYSHSDSQGTRGYVTSFGTEWHLFSLNPGSNRFTIDKNKNISTLYYNSESESLTQTDDTFTKTNLYGVIFGIAYTNETQYAQSGVRLYSYKTYNSDTLARDYIPCYRKSDNKPGLYDVVHGVFYINANSEGEFVCGPNIPKYIEMGLTTRILKGYIGDSNNIARQIYQYRLYLFHNGIDNTALTGGWTGSFTHKTNSGSNYTMTRMANDGTYLSGSFSSSNGSSEKALYVRSVNAIDFSNYKKLCCNLEWYTSRASSSLSPSSFGVFNSSYTTCETEQLATRFLVREQHTASKNSEYTPVHLEIDLSNFTGSGFILYDNYQPNMNAAINVRIKEIWLE